VAAQADLGRRVERSSLLNDTRVRGIIFQILAAVAVGAFVAYIIYTTAQSLTSGLGFFESTAGFDIGFRLIPYEMTSSYGRAFLVGLVNTLVVSAVGVVLATILGFIVGMMRLSGNWLVVRIAAVFVETLRNTPLLLQIVFWYFGVLSTLPNVRQSLAIGEVVYLNNRGLAVPAPIPEAGFSVIPIALVVGIAAAIGLYRWARRRQELTGQQFPAIRIGFALVIGLPAVAATLTGFPLSWDMPQLQGFNFVGGARVLPEFVALLLALSLYTAAFIAEIVRSGIQSVSHGQTEAALALGLRPSSTTRLIIIPQALRVIVPPLTSQYLNLVKNSSLAVVIGYPDLVSVFSGTVLNQTGQAVEVIAITMAVYMTISLLISLFMNWYNRRVRLVER